MNPSRPYCLVTGLIFAIVGLFHLARAVAGWPAVIAGVDIPVVMSWPIALVTLALSAWGLRSAR